RFAPRTRLLFGENPSVADIRHKSVGYGPISIVLLFRRTSNVTVIYVRTSLPFGLSLFGTSTALRTMGSALRKANERRPEKLLCIEVVRRTIDRPSWGGIAFCDSIITGRYSRQLDTPFGLHAKRS